MRRGIIICLFSGGGELDSWLAVGGVDTQMTVERNVLLISENEERCLCHFSPELRKKAVLYKPVSFQL